MSDILDLPNWTLLDRTQEDGCDVLDAEYRPQPTACLKCGVVGELYRHGTKPVTYLDSPIRGNPAKLRAKVQRYRCTACKETFLQPLGGIQTELRMSELCAIYIQSMCLRDTFTRTRNYDGILSACTYATSTVPKFAAEGQRAVDLRDQTWASAYSILEEVVAGERPVPATLDDVEPDLPVLSWSN